jgi:hypothetical protein
VLEGPGIPADGAGRFLERFQASTPTSELTPLGRHRNPEPYAAFYPGASRTVRESATLRFHCFFGFLGTEPVTGLTRKNLSRA